MITRRQFLIGAGSTLTLPLVNKFVLYLEYKGAPLIEAPSNPNDILYVNLDEDYSIELGKFPDEIPTLTWREFLFERLGYEYPKRLSDFRQLYEEWGVKPHEFDDEYEDYYMDCWIRCESPSAQAFHLLQELDIGPLLSGPGDAVGGLSFIDGPSPCSNYVGVHADDDLSISLLQQRLNDLGTGIAVEMIG